MKNSAAVSCVCVCFRVSPLVLLLLVTFLDSLFTTHKNRYQLLCPSSRGENVVLNEFTSSILLFFTFSLFPPSYCNSVVVVECVSSLK